MSDQCRSSAFDSAAEFTRSLTSCLKLFIFNAPLRFGLEAVEGLRSAMA